MSETDQDDPRVVEQFQARTAEPYGRVSLEKLEA